MRYVLDMKTTADMMNRIAAGVAKDLGISIDDARRLLKFVLRDPATRAKLLAAVRS